MHLCTHARSGTHCKIFLDGNGHVQVLDESSNGTWWNYVLMGRGHLRPLSSMDTIVLLHPNPPGREPSNGSGDEGIDGQPAPPGVVPRAVNYQFMFIDLRPPKPMPPPPAVPAPQLLRGTSLWGRPGEHGRPEDYHKVSELGTGSFAVVYKVVHVESGIEYAMKVMEKKKLLKGVGGSAAAARGGGGLQYAELRDKVLSEARILRTVDHPHVIRFVDIFETEQHLHLVMELVEGKELFEALVDKGPFAEPDARAIMHQLLTALKYLHARHIVHRDLKPENILLQTPPPSSPASLPCVKIADFGLAKLVGTQSKAATFCGTPQYFAPEVLESRNSRRGYDTACDMWSVGVLMYVLLSSLQPFADDSEEGGAPQVTDGAPQLTIYEKIREGVSAAHFAEPIWEKISSAAKHLICQLLVVDPKQRISVEAALNHPWMRGEAAVDGDVPQMNGTRMGCDEIEDSDDDNDDSGGSSIAVARRHARMAHASRHRHIAAAVQLPFPKRQRTTVLYRAPPAHLPVTQQRHVDSQPKMQCTTCVELAPSAITHASTAVGESRTPSASQVARNCGALSSRKPNAETPQAPLTTHALSQGKPRVCGASGGSSSQTCNPRRVAALAITHGSGKYVQGE